MGGLFGREYINATTRYDSIHDIPVYDLDRRPTRVPKREKNYVIIIPNNVMKAREAIARLLQAVARDAGGADYGLAVIPTDSYSSLGQTSFQQLQAEFTQAFPQHRERAVLLLKEELREEGSQLVRFLNSRFDRGLPRSSLAALKKVATEEFDDRLKRAVPYEQYIRLL